MIVVDTSVAIKWLRGNEKDREYALSIYKDHLKGKEKIIAPPLFYIEAANALATNNVLSGKDISEGMQFLFDSCLGEYTVGKEDIVEAGLLAKKFHVTVYDMLYAIVAKNKKTILITADEKFANKVNFSFVQTLSKLN